MNLPAPLLIGAALFVVLLGLTGCRGVDADHKLELSQQETAEARATIGELKRQLILSIQRHEALTDVHYLILEAAEREIAALRRKIHHLDPDDPDGWP